MAGIKKTKKSLIPRLKRTKNWKNLLIYTLVFVFLAFLFMGINQPGLDQTSSIPLSQAISEVKKGNVREIEVLDNKLILKMDGKKVEAFKEPGSNIYTLFKDAGVPLDKTKVIINDKTTLNNWINIIASLLPIILMVGFFYFIFRQARGAQENIFSFGQSRAKLYSKDTPKIGFGDVAGVDEAKQELTEVVDFLKNPGKYRSIGARTPKGVLMIGPSGTGKTLLARATAGEANVPFFSMAGSEFMEMLVGVGASRVRDLFNTAKKNQPAIIFIDEIDAIGRQRGFGFMGGHDEREQTLNQILVEMDGFSPNEQLVVMAASVTGDTPIMVKRDSKVSIVPIGDFADSYYKEDEERVEKEVENVKTLGLKKKIGSTNKLFFERPAFKSIRSVFRHRVNEIYEIKYKGGVIKATGNHSVFVRRGNAIITKPVSQLSNSDILVDIPFKYLRSKDKVNAILTNSFKLKLPVYIETYEQQEMLDKYIYVMEQGGVLSQQAIGRNIGVSQTTVGHWQRQDRLPRMLSRAYFKEKLPEEIDVTTELARLMGYYTAEGYARKEIDFCFNKNEKHLIEDVIHLMELVFRFKPHAVRSSVNAVNIIYQSRPLANFFIEHCGKGAHNKHVPQFLFEAPKEYFIEFLRGVFEGDGYEDKRGKGEITSVSKQLITELNWLCRMHGIKTYVHLFTAKEGRIIKEGKPLRAVTAYRLGWGKNANPFLNNKTDFSKLARVISVKKIPYEGYVYDLCGVENEAFFGGESPILLHNTNRPDVLDPALVRPGRFDRRVALELPDVEGRKAILAIHAKNKPFESKVDWSRVAKRTVGFSGADLENMLNEAAIRAARLNKKKIDMSDLEEAATKVKLGPEKKRLQTDEDRRMTAYHEAGHALVAWEMPHIDPIHRISIVSRGMSLGHTMTEPIDRVHETKSHLLEEIAMMLGGQAAERLVFNDITTGASNDLEKATQVARAMVTKFGMSSLGPITFDIRRETPYDPDELSPEMAAKVDIEVKRIIDEAFDRTTKVLKRLRKKLDLLAEELLKVETLESEQFEKLIGPKKTLPGSKPAVLPVGA